MAFGGCHWVVWFCCSVQWVLAHQTGTREEKMKIGRKAKEGGHNDRTRSVAQWRHVRGAWSHCGGGSHRELGSHCCVFVPVRGQRTQNKPPPRGNNERDPGRRASG